jgi:hypothetical protein
MSVAIKTRCDTSQGLNGIAMTLLVVDSGPAGQDEHMVLNLLKDRMRFRRGDVIECTFRNLTEEQGG